MVEAIDAIRIREGRELEIITTLPLFEAIYARHIKQRLTIQSKIVYFVV
jgi:hypothetical protein